MNSISKEDFIQITPYKKGFMKRLLNLIEFEGVHAGMGYAVGERGYVVVKYA